jgi:hypothetical protein
MLVTTAPDFQEFLKRALEPDPHQRRGQKFINLLYSTNPVVYEAMTQNAELDPYYDDRRLWAAVEFARENWNRS